MMPSYLSRKKGLGLVEGDLLLGSDAAALALALLDARARLAQHHEEVHAEDARARVVLHAQVDVLRNAEAEAARVAEARVLELVLLHLQRAVQDLARLLAAHSHEAGNLLVSTDAERADRVLGSAVDGLLSSELLDHTRRLGELIAGLAHVAVHDQ